MTTNAIAMSRDLVGAGIERKAADAIAEAVVSHADESHATKANIAEFKAEVKSDTARLEGKIETLAAQVKFLTGLVLGLYVGLAVLIVKHFSG